MKIHVVGFASTKYYLEKMQKRKKFSLVFKLVYLFSNGTKNRKLLLTCNNWLFSYYFGSESVPGSIQIFLQSNHFIAELFALNKI